MGRAMNIRLLFVLLPTLLFCSCSDLTGEGSQNHEIGNSSAVKIGGRNAVGIDGKGFLLEGTVSAGGNSGHKFSLRFKLPEGESLKFFFFASRELSGGVEMSWERSSGGEVRMEMSLNGKTLQHQISELDDVDEIAMDVDVHNNHADIHILVWNNSGPRRDNEGCTFDGGCVFNTEDFAFEEWLGVGRASGVYWGMQGDDDLIISLEGPLTADSNA